MCECPLKFAPALCLCIATCTADSALRSCSCQAWTRQGLLTAAACGRVGFCRGSGMICPHIVNWSMMLGAIISWGIMWPLFTQKEGIWWVAASWRPTKKSGRDGPLKDSKHLPC
jgi:hypothetical protein